ncbi:MAG: heme exporter protein CcmD [Methylococcaceae bacterium]|nr:MAG: heme exporter protein CcmD [Methylococcaceae bacterium]
MSIATFFAMGGYAFYVWTAYGICFLVLVFNILMPIRQRLSFLQELARKQQRQQ